MCEATQTERWLLLIYRVPQEPPARRTYVWRQLRQLGAIYLQQAAAILPDVPHLLEALGSLANRIRDYGGEVSLLTTTSPDREWGEWVRGRFNEARDAEYAELVENVDRFEDEIRREERRGRFTFAQLEDVEADWEKVQRWHERVHARDFFSTPTREVAEEALKRGQAELDEFTAKVYAQEQAQSGPGDG